ncbi:uncharacterized protein V6R79_022340 [Siganus canaliculatus]
MAQRSRRTRHMSSRRQEQTRAKAYSWSDLCCAVEEVCVYLCGAQPCCCRSSVWLCASAFSPSVAQQYRCSSLRTSGRRTTAILVDPSE